MIKSDSSKDKSNKKRRLLSEDSLKSTWHVKYVQDAYGSDDILRFLNGYSHHYSLGLKNMFC
ncbi:hypothetical protein A0J61_05774 [Choanephora cucurbitarum]|uniref:Uncharacterized protein n=1 Tax=Choanephora cucurbitarum TaxID=101091 RepID=A0A1C7NBP3_9FUNG|nr:hypothetical protein A0J61_05774 [Choanephora cucurbitarum]